VSFARISAVAAALAAMLAQQACASTGSLSASGGVADPATSPATSPATASAGASPATSRSAASPASPASPATSSSRKATAPSNVFSGDRQVYLLPLNSEATLAVGKSGRVELSEDFGDRALFVLTPVGGGQYWIQTAKLRTGGEAYCLGVKGKNVSTVACDAAAGAQLFRFRKTGTSDGKPRYTIRTGADTYLVQDPQGTLNPGGTGVAAIQIGEGTPDIDTPFLLADRGRASMPNLD